ncbi:MAG: hypothetical protein RID23_16560 [Roseovarius sp.]
MKTTTNSARTNIRVENPNRIGPANSASDQRAHGINRPVAFSRDPMQNKGCNRPLDIIIPDGCFPEPEGHAHSVARNETTAQALSAHGTCTDLAVGAGQALASRVV